MKAFLFLAILSTVICVSVSAFATTFYVDGAVSSSGDGKSWGTALKTIQEGIDAASDFDTVIVAEGVYIENIQFSGKNIVLTSTDPLDPAVVAGTIMDGNQLGSVVTFSGTETETCVLSGFTIRNGEASGNGGGVCGGTGFPYIATHATITNNTITGNSASGKYGGGGGLSFCNGAIQNNTIAGNSAGGWGGGLSFCGGTIQNNTIIGNSAVYGGGLHVCDATIQNNTIRGNSAVEWGGGLDECGGTIHNNAITGNSAGDWGGGLWRCIGTTQNNTITGNSAGMNGGGLALCEGRIRNCIVWGNTAPSDPQLYRSDIPTFSCIEGWSGGGRGNIAATPAFVNPKADDYRLQPGSPCIDAGASYYWFAWPQRDLDGNCRLAGLAVDMGCYEYGSSIDTDGDLLSDADESAAGTNPLKDDTDGDGLRDGLELLRGSNPLQLTLPGTLNVPSDFPTVQKALCVSISGDEVIVAPGAYPENLQFCGPDVILRSSDPGDATVVGSTILDGGASGPVVSFRGAESGECLLAGLTIRNGLAAAGGGIHGNGTAATIQNNVITGNSARGEYGEGGGLRGCNGTIQSNTITGNSASTWGGGLCQCNGTIQNNTIKGNSAQYGGGLDACEGTVQNNAIRGNSAAESGGGLASCSGTVRNNTITENSAEASGGGLADCNGAIQNNTITENSAEWGGGLDFCDATIRNCIIWANTALTDPQLFVSSAPTYSCIEGWTGGGEGNISPKYGPGFVNPNEDDYHLKPGSPCIDAGINEDWMWTATDLDGNPRVFYGALSLTVDMGAYEYGSWLFRISQVLAETAGGLRLTWATRPGDEYAVWSRTDLTLGDWTQEATVPSAGDSTSWTDPSPSGSRKFYRVELN